jgi:hypothetical protein
LICGATEIKRLLEIERLQSISARPDHENVDPVSVSGGERRAGGPKGAHRTSKKVAIPIKKPHNMTVFLLWCGFRHLEKIQIEKEQSRISSQYGSCNTG